MGIMRGSVSGSLWALVLGGAGLGIASQVSDPPVREAPVDIAASTVGEAIEDQEAPVLSDAATPETDVIVPVDEGDAQPDVAEVTETAQQEPPVVPEVTAAEPDVVVPADALPTENVVAPDRPVLPGAPVVSAPVVTQQADDVPQVTTPAPVPEVEVQEATGADAVITDDADRPNVPLETVPDAEVAIVEDAPVLEAPQVEEAPVPDVSVAVPAPADPLPELAEESDPLGEPEQPSIVTDAPEVVIAPDPVTVVPSSDDAPDAEIAELLDEPATAPDDIPPATVAEPATTPVIVKPEVPATVAEAPAETEVPETETAAVAGVRVNRPGAAPAESAGQEAEIVTDEAEIDDDAPAIARYAAPFENPQALPLLSFVLVDDGVIGDAASDLAELNLPITVILDPLDAGAVARMSAYRAAEVEIGLQTSLPPGATPTDVEIAFEAALGALPEAVVLLSIGDDGVQQDRSVTAQVMQVLAAEGRGLVTVQRGFGNALRAAAQADVPAAAISGNLADQGENEAAINRALDQAAFRARQTGDAVVLGQLNAYTLAALKAWALGLDNDQLKLAPVTAILSKVANEQ